MSFKDFYIRNFKRNFGKFYFDEKKRKHAGTRKKQLSVYRWVHPSAMSYVAQYGILGYGAAANNDDVVGGLGDMAEAKLRQLAETGEGPIMLVAPPPSNDILNPNHPVITKSLKLIKIDLGAFMDDNPNVIVKFKDHSDEFERTKLDTLQQSGKVWDKYDNKAPSHEYASGVPKIVIGNADTVIDPKYITF